MKISEYYIERIEPLGAKYFVLRTQGNLFKYLYDEAPFSAKDGGGLDFSVSMLTALIKEAHSKHYCDGLYITGGEPLNFAKEINELVSELAIPVFIETATPNLAEYISSSTYIYHPYLRNYADKYLNFYPRVWEYPHMWKIDIGDGADVELFIEFAARHNMKNECVWLYPVATNNNELRYAEHTAETVALNTLRMMGIKNCNVWKHTAPTRKPHVVIEDKSVFNAGN